MDVIGFLNPTSPTKMEQGRIINGLKSKLWIERYALAGEFKFVADVSSGIREKLPIGSFVSHIATRELMIVENHEINDSKDKEAEIIISGRGYETFFENRIVGSNWNFPTSGNPSDYTLTASELHDQIIYMLNDHLLTTPLFDDNNALPYVSTGHGYISDPGPSVARSIKRGDLYTRLQELLAVRNLGIRVERPGVGSVFGGGTPNTGFYIHEGNDLSSTIVFSQDTGEILGADYLWSNKKVKTAAMIFGRWVQTFVATAGENGYDRRVMLIDASDIDQGYETAPAGGTLTAVVAAMQQRGLEAIAARNDVALTNVEVSKNATKAIYRIDFNVGDIISVSGSYNATSKMRIGEYVEIEDETGESSYPTLVAV